jgi:hypothetical protein
MAPKEPDDTPTDLRESQPETREDSEESAQRVERLQRHSRPAADDQGIDPHDTHDDGPRRD